MYFKVLGEINDNEDKWEYVSGYYDLNDTNPYGAIRESSGGEYTHGYIQLKTTCAKDRESNGDNCSGIGVNEVNPIAKAIWQFIRLNMPKEVHGDTDDIGETVDEDAVLDILQGMATMFEGVLAFAHGGYNKELRNRDFGKHIKKGKSWIRLYNPQQSKLGGTHRVKKITISDNWSNMSRSASEDSAYGQEYIYTTENSSNEIISSGVAAYEPLIGGDEIPLRLPDKYDKENRLAPDDEHYLEHPYGESFYPGPSIIYSKVRVQNLQVAGLTKHATGYTINEFYTAKDFPVKTRKTRVQQERRKGNPILKLLKVKSKDNLTLSQGYVVELNDMHGKPKATKVYDEYESIISGVEYEYQTETSSTGFGTIPKLDNRVNVINKDGSVEEAYLGLDFDMVADHRESKSKHQGGGVDLNNDNFLIGFLPIATILPYMMWSVDEVQYRSITLTKVIRRSGVLKKTTAFDLGSSVATNNLYYDAETGNPLVTQTFNEFEDPIYNFNYPAHWAYESMQQAYQNIGMEMSLSSYSSVGTYSLSHSEVYKKIIPGDELLVNESIKAWVLSKDGTSFIYLIDRDGLPIDITTPDISAKVIRSGYRNMASASIGSITSLNDPIDIDRLSIDIQDSIINASVIEYDDNRLIHCSDDETENNSLCDCIPTVQNSTDFHTITYSLFEDALDKVTSYSGERSNMIQLNLANRSFIEQNDNIFHNAYGESNQCECQSTITCRIRDRKSHSIAIELSKCYEAEPTCHCEIQLFIPGKTQSSDGELLDVQFNSKIRPTECKKDRGLVDVTLHYQNRNVILKDVLILSGYDNGNGCFDFFSCSNPEPTPQCETNIGESINPYVQNLIGNHKPQKSYTSVSYTHLTLPTKRIV